MRRNIILVLNGLAILALAFSLSRISFAQSPRPERIAGPIAGSPAVWLEGNRRPMFQPENDQGPAPDSLKLENITLVFKPTEEQQANLAALLAQQQDRSSPLYHQWLTPEQFADNFGLSPTDVAKVVAWLQSQGFTITQTARSRLWVSFSGAAAQVQSAFHTEIHYYSVEGETYYANASEPAVPAALADVVLGFHSLDNYRLKPRGVFRQVEAGPNPDFTSYLSSKNFVTPADFAIIYDLNTLYGIGIDGTNQTIAVMGQTDLYNGGSDITAFRSAAGLTGGSVTPMLDTKSSDPGLSKTDINEASLDVEWSGAVAKNAKIIYFYSTDVIRLSLYDAIDQKLSPVISISYGNCEAGWGATNLNTLAQMAQQANAQGQTILSAAGDSGAADCDYSTNTSSPVTSATHGLAVDAPASLPYVTGMGGTEFNEGAGNYWLPATGGTDVLTSALSYIPGMVWNDTSSPQNTTGGLLAGGGGASSCGNLTGNTCTGGFPKPSWQTGPGVPNDNVRDVPDLSMNASSLHEGLLICVQGSCVNGYRGTVAGGNLLTVAGGTSAAAPTFAGIVALINQQYVNNPPGQGNINPILYSMAANSPAAFHDITTGSNIVPCTSGTPNCPASAPFQFGFNAGVGYDQASGLGSVDAYNLVTMWNSPATGNLPAPTLTAPANGLTAAPLTTTFSWTGVPNAVGYRILVTTNPTLLTTNPATASCNGCTIFATTTGNSVTSYTPATGVLAAPNLYYWQVQALPSSIPATGAWSSPFVFNTGTPDFTLSASPNNVTVAPGNNGTSTLTLYPTGGFLTTSVTFTCTASATLVGVTCTVGSLGGNNQATVNIIASSTATSYPALPRNPPYSAWWVCGVALICILLIALSKPRRDGAPGFCRAERRSARGQRRWPLQDRLRPEAAPWNLRLVALGVILAALLLASLTCGGGSSGGGGTTGPPPESGTVTITGTSSTTPTHTATINVSVS